MADEVRQQNGCRVATSIAMAAVVTGAEIIASSGIVGGALASAGQVAKSWNRQICQWLDRKLGLKVLKTLPMGLEALVYGEEVTPELLAALSAGGEPGHKLGTLALLTTTQWGFTGNAVDVVHALFREEVKPLPNDPPACLYSRMNGDLHEVHLLYDSVYREMRLNTHSHEMELSLHCHADVVVVGYCQHGAFAGGVVVYGPAEDCFYYCESRLGHMQYASVDTCPKNESGIDVTSAKNGSRVFTVTPGVFRSYTEFFRMSKLLRGKESGVVQILGVAEVARSLGLLYAEEATGGGSEDLFSVEYLRSVRLSSRRRHQPRRVPEDIRSLVRDAAAALPLCDRKYERTRFDTTQATTAAYVEAVRSLGGRTGNVGVRYTESNDSCLIRSCVVGTLGMEASFGIFHKFSSSRVNIDVSPGCTAIYFPGLNFTVAFPDGSEAESTVKPHRPACPFTSDLSETIRVLVDLAPRIGAGRLRKVATVLSEELGSDPSLVLNPLTELVIRSFSRGVDETLAKHSLIELLNVSSLGVGLLHREAAVAGVLSQLGLSFSVAGGPEMRCFFDCCRKAGWGNDRGNIAEVSVDCKVDVSGCFVYSVPQGVFLGDGGSTGAGYYAKLTGPGIADDQIVLEDCQQGGNYHLTSAEEREGLFSGVTPRPFPVKCYVGSGRTPASQIVAGWKSSGANVQVIGDGVGGQEKSKMRVS